MKINQSMKHISAKCIKALSDKVYLKEEKIVYNDLEGSILAVSPITKRMKLL